MTRFAQDAQRILDAAESAPSGSEKTEEMTILIGPDGIRIIPGSDWPLDSLLWHHGAQAAYRVKEHGGSVRVEGREGSRSCVFESKKPAEIARLLLAR